MNTKELEHFRSTDTVGHDRALEYLHCEMPIEDLVAWLIELVPANYWGEFIAQFQTQSQAHLPLETAMKGWKKDEQT